MLEIGVDTLPKLPMDAGDRNRTSPFAFTGNRFEFRAVGGGQSIGGPIIAVNTAVAESVDYIATKLEAAVAAKKPLNEAIQTLLAEIANEHDGVVFNGDGYSAEWHAEAEKRGLPNLKTTPEALKVLEQPESVKLFEKYAVLSPREMHSRYEIYLEQYVKTVAVEGKLTLEIAETQILPAAIKYLAELGNGLGAAKALGVSVELKAPRKVAKLAAELEASIEALEAAMAHHGAKDTLAECEYLCAKVLPAMLAVRSAADGLEASVSDELWPLPTYQEMLFMR
jgi:glutamine synthetase